MSIDLQTPMAVGPAHVVPDEFRTTQDECGEFFGDVFDQLHVLSLELFARHKCLEVGAEQKSESERTLTDLREEFRRGIEELMQLHGRFQADRHEARQAWAEIQAGCQRSLDQANLCDLRDSFRQMAAEFSGLKEEMQQMRSLLESK